VSGLARAILAAALLMLATAQAPRVGETIEVSIVNLDVVVTDRGGKPIRGLKAEDFELRDEGKLQPITNFSELSGRPAPSSAEGGREEGLRPSLDVGKAYLPNDRRNLIVFIERFLMPQRESERFFGEIKTLIRDVVRPGDSAAIVTWNYVMKVRQDFTSDVALLEKALDAVAAEMQRLDLDAESVVLRNAYVQELLDEAALQQDTPESQLVPSPLLDGREGARRAMIDIRRKAYALNTLINSMAAAPGKRVLMMATRRFSQYAGAEYFAGEMTPDQRDEFDTFEVRREVWDSANAAGVTIYPIFPEGAEQVVFARVEDRERRDAIVLPNRGLVRRDGDRWQEDAQKLSRSGLTLMNETAAIDEVAKQTGGVSAWGKTDIIRLAETIRSDITSYYSIGFRAGPATGKPRRISLTTKNPSYRVRTRREYVPKSDSARMKERVRSSLYTTIEKSRLTFDVAIGKITRSRRRFRIPVQIRIPAQALTALPAGAHHAGSFSVFSAAGGMMGIMSDVSERAQDFSIRPGDLERAGAALITYDLEILSDARADRISIGVLDETSKEWGVVTVKLAKDRPRT
jgi:VWFA-related protein